MDEGLQWTDWPARRAPARAAATLGVVAIVTVAIVGVDPVLGFVGTLLLLVSITDFLFPTRFQLTAEEIRIRNPLRSVNRPWSRLGPWGPVPGGFAVQGRSPSALLRRLRGVELRCPGREVEVEARLRQHLGPPVSETGAREEEDAVG